MDEIDAQREQPDGGGLMEQSESDMYERKDRKNAEHNLYGDRAKQPIESAFYVAEILLFASGDEDACGGEQDQPSEPTVDENDSLWRFEDVYE